MAVRVIMPQMGLTMTNGKIVRWLKNEGDQVKKGEPLLEIKTEKIVTEVESPGDGILIKIFNQPEDLVPVTEPIAIIALDGEDTSDLIKEIESEKAAGEPAPADEKEEPKPAAAPASPAADEKVVAATLEGGRIKASPLAKKIAAEKGFVKELGRIKGTGPGGRIVKKDVLAYAERRMSQPSTAFQAAAETWTEPLTELRKSIASRMTGSWQTPHFYLETEIDAGPLQEMRTKINNSVKEEDIKFSMNDLLVKIVARVLSENRYMNATYTEQGIVCHGEVNVGVAVAIDEGLIVPVVKNADLKGLKQISGEARELITKAKDNTLGLDDITGGTFTITNLGMFPVDAFTAIVNPPEAAILAVGRVVEKPVCVNGEVVVRACMRMTLGIDHRALDGAKGARFLAALKETLENPYLLAL